MKPIEPMFNGASGVREALFVIYTEACMTSSDERWGPQLLVCLILTRVHLVSEMYKLKF